MRRMLAVLALLAALTLAAVGASALDSRTASASTGAQKPVTITFWNGFTARELGIINQALVGFHKKYPWITVKSTGALTPDKLTAAIRGGNAPDAASLFETDDLGAFCSSGAFQDLGSYIERDKLNMSLFPKT